MSERRLQETGRFVVANAQGNTATMVELAI